MARPASCQGVTLHGGRRTTLTLKPAPAGQGIAFVRRDLGGATIPASYALAVDRPLCTTLHESEGKEVRTVEHLMCALYAGGIDNVIAEIDSDEVPIMDGSAKPLLDLVEQAGRHEFDAPRRYIKIKRPVEFRHHKSHIRVEPAPEFRITVVLGVPYFGTFEWSGIADRVTVAREIVPARTFGRLEGALPLKLISYLGGPRLLRGASLKSGVTFYKGRVINRGGLRFKDEFVRHHTLDAIGDLSLAGAPIHGHVTLRHTRHGLTQQFLKILMSETDAWEYAV